MAHGIYFTDKELQCKCGCGQNYMNTSFMYALDVLRERYGKPIVLSSAYRCPEYNDKVSSTGRTGPHTTGKAVDIVCRGTDAYEIMHLAFEIGFSGIGVSQKGDSRFLHLDMLDHDLRPWVWSY